ncbi:Asp-tRNA(Asn)/Glu-tRNA(Gln) amidotransferase subunit GatB [Candidatus Microgenomates bacterium]|nr:Asp-tRNA(Asn)/Glu-tRNA(Gln) amidotransferase subunit GatB [Candidatus Microgenomates bacterium]
MTYQPIIGLEVHVELATKSKMFCGCSAEHFGVEPNTHTCPVCLGLPGALPVPNKKAVEWTVKLALALGCQINLESHFDRKNYFYPDLPKGYQITQYEKPFGEWGKLGNIRIRRVHLEEDTGKLQHQADQTLVDFNRSSVPLVEIVTEPDFRNLEDVDLYLKKLQKIIRYLEISNADMEKGSMRLEPSISIMPLSNSDLPFPLPNDQLPNYRVELKNINSFRFVKRALEYEIKRQSELLDNGEKISQQTRGWSEPKGVTFPQREKEEAHDYRYFPEPDIPPIVFTQARIDEIKAEIPELPEEKSARFQKQYSLSGYDANLLVEDRKTGEYFEQALMDAKDITAKEIANWIINKKVDLETEVPAQLVEKIMKSKNTVAADQKELEKIIDEVLVQNIKAVEDYRNGKTQVLMYLIGKIFQKFSGLPKDKVIEILKNKLDFGK